MILSLRGISDAELISIYNQLERSRAAGELNFLDYVHLDYDYLSRMVSLTPLEREEIRMRERMADAAAQREAQFFREHRSRWQLFDVDKVDVEINAETVLRILDEYTPFLQGNQDPRYHVFVRANGDNFREDVTPEVSVYRINTELNLADETITFKDYGFLADPNSLVNYENFAIGGRVTGLYVPDTIVTYIKDSGIKVTHSISLVEDAVIREAMKQRGLLPQSPPS